MQNFWKNREIKKDNFNLIQINIGNLCNLKCHHCHVGASPKGEENMSRETALKIIEKIKNMKIQTIEFTGGTPEMNENFLMFIEELSLAGRNIIVRTSLTILAEEKYRHFIEVYRKYNVKVIASLPSVFEEKTTEQRGEGVYDTTIEILRELNTLGYATTEALKLDLVYNPVGTYLPKAQKVLESEYKVVLKERFDVAFNSLACIVNMPIKRFKSDLKKQKLLETYMETLYANYNEHTLNALMCRNIITISYDGYIYDCDFNLALRTKVQGYKNVPFWEIDFEHFEPNITFDAHCYACTVNQGSSCTGEVVEAFDAKQNAQEYYGEVLSSSEDLQTTACCTLEMVPQVIKETLPYIVDEIKDKYYGCGSVIPTVLENQHILDLGCGSGRDVYILSKLVGQKGFVHGIDMTKNQIEVAQKYQKEQTKRFDYKEVNTNFIHDYIENIDRHFEENSLDIITSNCVINLLEDKRDIFKKVHKLLKNGGEFYFSDVYASRRLPKQLKEDKVLHGECLGGALYFNDFTRYVKEAGFTDPRVVSSKEILLTNEKLKERVGAIKFYSITYRLWKLEGLDMVCEDYGQFATYKGGVEKSENLFSLDINHLFEKNRAEKVCKNTADMLSKTRYAKYFDIVGDTSQHFGEFLACATLAASEHKTEEQSSSMFCNC